MNSVRHTVRAACVGRLLLLAAAAWVLSLALWPRTAVASEPIDLAGRWVALPADGPPVPVDRVAPTGGRFRFEAVFAVQAAGTFVIDFDSSTVVDRFVHHVTDAAGRPVAELAGGIGDPGPNPYMLRHGRELVLAPGQYRLVTEVVSPFFLAHPEPYVDTQAHYRQAIQRGNALVLLCLGVFVGLGIYYACLAVLHRQRVHAMYALFILGNLLYNGTALLVFHDLFAATTFYLISVPILFSNIAYVVFVMGLLDLRRATTPRLHAAGGAVIGAMVAFIAMAALRPHWSLELDRIGVALFLVYGLTAGVTQAVRGQVLARWYLVANVGFFVSGLMAISLINLQGVQAVVIEHLGLLAVTIEVVLLAFVLSYQFGLLRRDKDAALARAEGHLRLASTDTLTGLPNRYALDQALAALPPEGTLTFVDLDGLKHYNDHHGHARGDALLRAFATELAARLGGVGTAHRLGGDEFAITSVAGRSPDVERAIQDTVLALHASGFPLTGASRGSVRRDECADAEALKHTADERMYDDKRLRRLARGMKPALARGPA